MRKITVLFCALLLSLLSYAQGEENFDNFEFEESNPVYQNGSFEGQDGSTWEYVEAREDIEIDGNTLTLHKNGNDAELTSGTLSGGMGTLQFDYMQAFSNDVELDVYVNDDLIYTATSDDEQDEVKTTEEIEVNIEGDIVLKFKNDDGAQVAIDNISWTAYEEGEPGGTTYCQPEFSSECDLGDMVDDFTLEGENDTEIEDLETGCSEDAYDDRTDQSVELAAGETYTADVVSGTSYNHAAIWIDFNDDGEFDEEERVGYSDGEISYSEEDWFSGELEYYEGSSVEIEIPEDVEAGEYRMRVIVAYNFDEDTGEFIEPCNENDGSYGETHDYTVIIDGEDTPGGGSGDMEECSQEIASPDELEDGYGNLHMLQVANDLIIDADGTFELQSIDFNVLTEPNVDINGVQLYFYSDSGDGPGDQLGSTEMMTPTDVEYLGEAFDHDRSKVSLDLEEPFLFQGSSNESAVWVGVTIDYSGESSYMEMQYEMVYGTESYLYNEDFDEWVAGSVDFGEAGEGIISFYGECGELEDCSGDPVAGEIDVDDSAVCPGESFTLTAVDYTQAAGITYQWQQSDDAGDTWTDIEGENSPSLSFPEGLEEDTDFRFSITCEFSDSSDTTDPVSITINSYEDCFCIPDMLLGCDEDMIDDFTLEGENNTEIEDLNTGCSPEGYEDHTDLSVDLGLTGQYQANVTTLMEGDHVAIWIDFNDNGVFDADELVGTASDLTPDVPSAVEISIPEDAELGEHRMRVMLGWSLEGGAETFDPCNANGAIWFGETHDYTVNIVQEMSVDNQIFEDFSFYPNPVENQLNLNANAQIESVEVFNLLGQSVIKENPNKAEIQLNTQALQTGVYMMKVTIDGSQKTFKVIKK